MGVDNSIVPYRGQAALVTTPASYSGAAALKSTYGIEEGPYLVRTPHSGLVIGPYNATVLSSNVGTRADMFHIEDDSVVTAPFRAWLESYCRSAFDRWGAETPGEGLTCAWSGIMAHSIDLVPLVGPVPGKRGLFVSAGYNGKQSAEPPSRS